MSDEDFFEDDEPVEKVVEAFERGEKKRTRPSWKFRAFHALDAIAHFLYCPTMHGRRHAVARWHHNIHLIPGFALAWICDRYDLWLGVTPDELHRTAEDETAGEPYDWADDPKVGLPEIMRRFDELDEAEFNLTDEEFERRAALGEPVEIVNELATSYRCDHMSVSIGGAAHWTSRPEPGCGCTMQAVYA